MDSVSIIHNYRKGVMTWEQELKKLSKIQSEDENLKKKMGN